MNIKATLVIGILVFFLFSSFISQTISAEDSFPSLTIIAPSQVNEGEDIIVTITSNDTLIENATVTFNGDIKHSNSSGIAIFTMPSILVDSIYNISALKEGYISSKLNITVHNILRLIIITNTSGYPKCDETGYTIDLFVADEQGQHITGAVVILNNESKITIDGKVSFKVKPMHFTSYSITATMVGFKSGFATINLSPCPTPGFELVFLICGIVLILLWKRKR